MTNDLRLEPISEAHADAVQGAAGDPLVLRFTLVPDPYPPDGARAFLSYLAEARRHGREEAYAIVERGAFAGVMGLKAIDRARADAEAGYWVAAEHRGRGVATRALGLLVAHAFGAMGLRALRATTLEENRASARVLEKAGFREIGRSANGASHPKWPNDAVLVHFRIERG